ncbi:stress protein [Coraliomargarita sinensis]|uniref:Stress protein n=1 Tax=Coraliomargarita sinensis TaxID=2174842 RepID=A0A317ZJ97_9BACT|nr:Dabb family protein [Coraliomargarita sinensis]PXA05062.1 stress protein [Coraliomargarita sinensis]
MIRHLLLIQFKDNATTEQIDEVEALFRAIPDKVDGVVSTEWGLNDSPEGKNKNFTHAVLMDFADEAGRHNYLPHPEHEALKAVFKPLVEDIIVFDYTVAD